RHQTTSRRAVPVTPPSTREALLSAMLAKWRAQRGASMGRMGRVDEAGIALAKGALDPAPRRLGAASRQQPVQQDPGDTGYETVQRPPG
ncbi:MAG: hypothetical protein ACRELT_10745, partial [Longimicrobiales bacterium]